MPNRARTPRNKFKKCTIYLKIYTVQFLQSLQCHDFVNDFDY